MTPELDPEDVVLLILDANERLLGHKQFKGVTRLEKLIFLLAREGGMDQLDELFRFRAYKFGPFSPAVYDAVDFLSGLKLLNVDERPYYSYYAAVDEEGLAEDGDDEVPPMGHEKMFTLTDQGRKAAANLRSEWKRSHAADLTKLDEIVAKMGSLPLNQIIRYVYRRYPKMAEKSIHPAAQLGDAEQ